MQLRTFGLSTLILISTAFAMQVSRPQPREGLRKTDYGAIALILKQELSAVGKSPPLPLCIRGPITKTPPRALLQYLARSGVEVSEPKACYPRGNLPRGLEVRLSNFSRGQGSLSVTVETGNLTTEPGVHVGELLRLGTYQLKQADDHKWTIVSYTNERTDSP